MYHQPAQDGQDTRRDVTASTVQSEQVASRHDLESEAHSSTLVEPATEPLPAFKPEITTPGSDLIATVGSSLVERTSNLTRP
jgi:hypothetical protein